MPLLKWICLRISTQNELHFSKQNFSMKIFLWEIKNCNYDFTFYFCDIDRFSRIESEIWESYFYQWLETDGSSAFTTVTYMGPLWKSN